MRDELGDILRQADEAMGSPRIDGQLAGKVRRRARSERMVRTVLGTGAFVVLGLLAIQFAPRGGKLGSGSGRGPVAVDVHVNPTDAKVDQMVGEILVKHQLEKQSTKVAARGDDYADDYLWKLSQERDRAALILVRSGDRFYAESHDRPAAEANYRLAIQLFPNSPSAAVARTRLREIDWKGSSL